MPKSNIQFEFDEAFARVTLLENQRRHLKEQNPKFHDMILEARINEINSELETLSQLLSI